MSRYHFPFFVGAGTTANIRPEESGLTVSKVLDAAKLIKAVPVMPQIIVTPNAIKDTDERLFPASRNRSPRIHKKLVKRFGGEFRKVPCVIQIGDKMYVHPAIEAELKQRMTTRIENEMERTIMGGAGYRALF
ncbi:MULTISPECIES: hypothetical protein [Bradyrhizobium]|uniref:hypothetical protein n=1 Tax=Bradyrhizobium TaxID=374 RepID=UPI0004B41D20|nr:MULTISPECIES: hypothetical protein [Bradyrhizobium]MBR0945246.1 hypothetical protein [Bradyrhizobium liaoningense]